MKRQFLTTILLFCTITVLSQPYDMKIDDNSNAVKLKLNDGIGISFPDADKKFYKSFQCVKD